MAREVRNAVYEDIDWSRARNVQKGKGLHDTLSEMDKPRHSETILFI